MNRLLKKGTVPAKNAAEIACSRVGIGFEKLDRGLFDPQNAYEPVAALGVKYARIQSGWMRTEQQKGVYDFRWIDEIVDNLLARKIEPWINLSYGNPIYTAVAKQFFGAVGCPPVEGEALQGWLRYIQALVCHMKGRVSKFEIWNEPDLNYSWRLDGKLTGVRGTNGTPNGTEYGEFAKASARAIHEANPQAYVIGFAIGLANHLGFAADALKTGMADELDAVSYHCYATETLARIRNYRCFEALVHSYNPKLDILQGESGAQSEFSLAGALRKKNWTREKQTKHLLRLMVTDLALDCKLVSYFSTMDMVEALSGLNSDKKSFMDYGFFGVLSADFDENGIATGVYTKKPSYFALQTVASLFAEDAKPANLPYSFGEEASSFLYDYAGAELLSFGFRLADGSKLLTYWRNTDIMTTAYDGTVTVELVTEAMPELIDLRDGTIYEFPEEAVEKQSSSVKLIHIPLRDYPLAIRFRDGAEERV